MFKEGIFYEKTKNIVYYKYYWRVNSSFDELIFEQLLIKLRTDCLGFLRPRGQLNNSC